MRLEEELTEVQLKLIDLENKYYEKFKEFYSVLVPNTKSDEEHIAILEECLRTGKKAENPELNSEVIY